MSWEDKERDPVTRSLNGIHYLLQLIEDSCMVYRKEDTGALHFECNPSMYQSFRPEKERGWTEAGPVRWP